MSWQHHRKLTTRQIFTLLMAGTIFCLIMPHRMTARFDSMVSRVISPFTKFLRYSALPARQTLRQQGLSTLSLKDIQDLQLDYKSLKNQNVNLQQALNQKNSRIDQLTHLTQIQGMDRLDYVIARVTGSDSDSKHQSLKLDQGTRQFIQPGQLVICHTPPQFPLSANRNTANEIYSMAVVGRISRENLGPRTSSIQLLNDPGFYMPVVIVPGPDRNENFAAQGFLQGRGLKEMTAQFEIKRVPSTYNIEPGDAVLIHAPKILPIDMVAGIINERTYDEKTAIEWKIQNIQPALNLYDLQKVYVIINPQSPDNPEKY